MTRRMPLLVTLTASSTLTPSTNHDFMIVMTAHSLASRKIPLLVHEEVMYKYKFIQ